MSLGRLLRTVRWLRTEQLIGRLRHRLRKPRAELRPAPPRRPPAGAWRTPPAREPSLVGPSRWEFLGEVHDLADIGWDHPDVALLWRYNQHYFDDLNGRESTQRRAWHLDLLQRWRLENPPGPGTAWAPYPTSLRIVNLVKAHLGGLPVDAEGARSLAVQARWLCQCLEWHLLGNHLFANAKALVFAGLFFAVEEADSWSALGLRILARELPEQFLDDGAQFERTPMYQAMAIEDLLDLLNLIGCLAPAGHATRALLDDIAVRAQMGLAWLQHMVHDDGSLARFNDSVDGIAPTLRQLQTYAQALGLALPVAPQPGLQMLQPSGYASWREAEALLLADVAPVGPDYLPGHAHADTLSFELSVRGQELIVNRGTSVYGTGERRQRERGTAAHSTVQIGDHDSSEVWAGFRVGRRARPKLLRATDGVLEASHDGYVHLHGRPVHRRRWTLEAGSLLVEDHLETQAGHPAVARFHLSPGLQLRQQADGWLVLDTNQEILARATIEIGRASNESWEHALQFGRRVPGQTLVVHLDERHRARVRWTW